MVVTAAFAAFGLLGVALAVIDVRTHRLPDVLVLPAYPVAILLLAAAVLFGADGAQLLRAGIGMVALFAFYLVLRLIRPAGMGGGDVKLAGIVGLFTAWQGWGSLFVGTAAAFILGGLVALILLAVRRADRNTAVPFGPFMIAGAWVGILAGHAVLPAA